MLRRNNRSGLSFQRVGNCLKRGNQYASFRVHGQIGDSGFDFGEHRAFFKLALCNHFFSIGSGERGWGGTITITGGTVDATNENSGAGIGGSGTPGTFSTGANGNAFITTSSIADQSSKEDWSGVIFEGNDGAVYGEQTIQTDTEIPAAKTLTIPDGSILTISSGVTLTNNGTIINNGRST